jgi:hypothetical protein
MLNPLQQCLADAPRHGIVRHDLARMGACSTGALGTHMRQCDHCHHTIMLPNACRERSCPFCRQRERAEWVRAREAELPPTGYFHVVFTIPAELRRFAIDHPSVFYGILMDCVRNAILDICGDPRHLGVVPAVFAVLHTWNQRMQLHPHVHAVISAGGLTSDGTWKHASTVGRKSFLVPQPVLRARFQTLLINAILRAFDQHQWSQLPSEWQERHALRHALIALRRRKWGIHLERPLNGPQALVRYLARYVNRVAIAPQRVIAYDGEMVTFTWQDRRHGNRECHEVLPAPRFLQRFIRHLPPRRFVRIRFWGLLAHRVKAQCAQRMQKILNHKNQQESTINPIPAAYSNHAIGPVPDAPLSGFPCPVCQVGFLRFAGGRTEAPAAEPPAPMSLESIQTG